MQSSPTCSELHLIASLRIPDHIAPLAALTQQYTAPSEHVLALFEQLLGPLHHIFEAVSERVVMPIVEAICSILHWADEHCRTGQPGGEAGTQPLQTLKDQGIFGDSSTRIFIMTPAIYADDLKEHTNTAVVQNSLINGNNIALFGQQGSQTNPTRDRLTPIENVLNSLFPGVPINYFVYRRCSIIAIQDDRDKLIYGGLMVGACCGLGQSSHQANSCEGATGQMLIAAGWTGFVQQ